MNQTAESPKALVIGNTAIDEFYRDGRLETTHPGGTAFNVASWFRHHEFQPYLCSTLGADFPDSSDIDTSLCEVVEADSPRCQVVLNESNRPEDRTWVQGEYQYRHLGTVEARFDVVLLTSGRTEFRAPFDTATASIKGFALDPLLEAYRAEQIAAYLTEADYLFLNHEERRVLEEKFAIPMRGILKEYGLRAALETSAHRVLLYEAGESVTEIPIDHVDDPVDTTGAGDAFAATFLAEKVTGSGTATAIRSAHEAALRTIDSVGAHPYIET